MDFTINRLRLLDNIHLSNFTCPYPSFSHATTNTGASFPLCPQQNAVAYHEKYGIEYMTYSDSALHHRHLL